MKPHSFWNDICNSVQEKMDKDPSKFYDWPEIRHTMLVTNAPWIYDELHYLFNDNYMRDWAYIVPDFTIGEELRSMNNITTQNTIHHCYSLAKWQKFSNKKIKDLNHIVEFGGGYGNTCRLARVMGFKGKYTIIDLPVFQKLQQYYLSNYNIEEDVEWKEPEEIEGGDLLIAQWSLSETPLSERKKVLDLDFKHYLIAFQEKFEDIDNVSFFSNLNTIPISHIPGNYYAFK